MSLSPFRPDHSPRLLSIPANNCGVSGENPSLVDFVQNAEENSETELAERVGVFERVFEILNVYSNFQLISRNRSDLASSNFRRRFRPFAGVCRFLYFNGTRNGTRHERLQNHARGLSRNHD